MGEVVEINMICKDIINPNIILDFIHEKVGNSIGKINIEKMDNWQFENVREISLEDALGFVYKNKIVCISEMLNNGAIGINIEKNDNEFCYDVWLNQIKYEDSNEYCKLIKEFLIFIKLEMKNQLAVCAIGKEVIFEAQNNHDILFQNAHNIDIWIDLNVEITENIMEKYEKIKQDDFTILKSKNLEIVL